jgi:hypothetical protein
MANLRTHEVPSPEATETLARIAERGRRDLAECETEARAIVEAVRERGDDTVRQDASVILLTDHAALEGLEGHWRSVERRLVARSADPVRGSG